LDLGISVSVFVIYGKGDAMRTTFPAGLRGRATKSEREELRQFYLERSRQYAEETRLWLAERQPRIDSLIRQERLRREQAAVGV
jgi:hypothetical protein